MRNLKKIIAVVVTLVMLFAISSISASAATAPVFSLRGATEANLTVAAGVGEAAEYYELAVILEDAENQVGGIEGVITYDPAIFVYQPTASEVGAALDDGSNTLENSIACDDNGTIKFVGVSNKAGVWFVLRFTVVATGSASFDLVAKAANAEGTASLTVTTTPLSNTAITNEAMINMEGGAILQKTHGLSSKKHVLDGSLYAGEKKVMDASVATPKAAIANKNLTTKIDTDDDGVKETTVTIGALSASGRTLVGLNAPIYQFVRSDDDRASEWAFSYDTINYESSNIQLNSGAESIFFYVELPEGDEEVYLGATLGMYNTSDAMKYLSITHNVPVYIMAEDTDEWVKVNSVSSNMYNVPMPQGFKGLVRVDHSALNAVDFSLARINLYLRSLDVNTTAYMSLPWLADEYNAEEYEAWYVATPDKVAEPSQELTFDVKVDSALVAEAEAAHGEAVEIGTLFMYTKRLNYRELKVDMTDKTGLAKAVQALAAEDEIVDFTVNLKNIKWNAMGVNVSARAYIKFTDGTVIYSKNYNNVFETNAGNARESVIGVAVDAVNAGHFSTVKAAKYGYVVTDIQAIAAKSSISGQDRSDLLNFIADCYEAPAAE